MVRILNTAQEVEIPAGVTVSVKNRVVTVTAKDSKGKVRELTRDFRHVQMDMLVVANKFRVELWWGNRKAVACCKTVVSTVRNLIRGVTTGYEYRLRAAYSHFPVTTTTTKEGLFEIRNYLGERAVRRVPIPAGLKLTLDTGTKDEVAVEGDDVNTVAQFAADVQQACRPRKKDIRKFLDGIYVSKRGLVGDA